MTGAAISARTAGIALVAGLSCGAQPGHASAADSQDSDLLEEIVVTGSHIHGAVAAGSKPIVITREQMDTSGYARIEDVLATVTQNSNRTNAATRDGDKVNNYDNRGAEVQLRGLGLGTTLTLVNGQRQEPVAFRLRRCQCLPGGTTNQPADCDAMGPIKPAVRLARHCTGS